MFSDSRAYAGGGFLQDGPSDILSLPMQFLTLIGNVGFQRRKFDTDMRTLDITAQLSQKYSA